MSGHVHAELMKLYAQDAAETAAPWKLWQYKEGRQDWCGFVSGHPSWQHCVQYRRKPRTHTVNGFEVPAPMVEAPEAGSWAFLADPTMKSSYAHIRYSDSDISACSTWLARGLVHATKEAAIANAKAMCGVQP